MGTEGLKVIRSRGKYFLWYCWSDGYVEEPGLGMEMYKMIPKSPAILEKWAQDLRADLDRLSETYYGMLEETEEDVDFYLNPIEVEGRVLKIGNNYEDEDAHTPTKSTSTTRSSFHRYPFYHLDHMPPADVFVHTLQKSLRYPQDASYAAYRDETPEEYRFNLACLGAPVVEDCELTIYKKYFSVMVAEPRDILSLGTSLSRCEDVSLRVLGSYVDTYIYLKLFIMQQEIALDFGRIGWNGREIACALAAIALLPFHIIGPPSSLNTWNGPWNRTFKDPMNSNVLQAILLGCAGLISPPYSEFHSDAEYNRWVDNIQHRFTPHIGFAYVTYWSAEFTKELVRKHPRFVHSLKRRRPKLQVPELDGSKVQSSTGSNPGTVIPPYSDDTGNALDVPGS
ncbi:hypothetical protein NM688_g4695 [Phlebia brevispora]|uniref:Uncharacterized protein n=1 Tax=Phlebia brevispora TaxID=194682 RepID=A0ACC1T272_9APHY|nr:hypothetical protein NM688_g4695 [Phlebia brevispora]